MFSAASSYSFIPPLFRLYYNTSVHHYLSTFLYVRKYHYFRKLLFYIRPAKMGSAQAKQFFLHNVTDACSLLVSRPWKKINSDQYCSKFNLSPIAPVGEGLNFKEQTITVCGVGCERQTFLLAHRRHRTFRKEEPLRLSDRNSILMT